MDNGISKSAKQLGRVEIRDRETIDRLTIRPSKQTVRSIEKIEELSLAAEQSLGAFLAR